MTGRSVVIVDDEITLAIVMRTLVLQGWPEAHVTVFTDPLNLGTRLRDVPPDSVVLMDRRLGGVESYGVISSLVAARPDIRVAMFSASLGPEEITRARHAGAFAAFEKPAALSDWRVLLTQVVPAPGEATERAGDSVA